MSAGVHSTGTTAAKRASGPARGESAFRPVVIDLPRRPPWLPLIVVLWLLAAVMGLLLALILRPGFGGSPRAQQAVAVVLVLGSVGFFGAATLTATRARLRWRGGARQVLMRAQVGGQVTHKELVWALARMARCNEEDARRLGRKQIDLWERRLGRSLPRVWIGGTKLAAALAADAMTWDDLRPGQAEPARRFPTVVRSFLWDGPLALMLGGVVVLIGGALTAAFSAVPRTGLVGVVLGTALWNVLFIAAAGFRGQRGWWLVVADGQARLVRRTRRGAERASLPIDADSTVVVVTSGGGRLDAQTGRPMSRFVWRFVPPAPAPAFDVLDFDPRGTPWERSVNLNLHSAEELGFGPRIG